MDSTQRNNDCLTSNREDFLCKILDFGGICLDNEQVAFQKKFFCESKK